MALTKLRSEWTHEEIIDACRRWCRGNGFRWNSTLEWRRRDELFDMFLSPTGTYGGAIRGHVLTYTNQQPLYKLDEQKLRARFDKGYRERPEVRKREALLATESRGHVYIPPQKRAQLGKAKPTSEKARERKAAGKYMLAPRLMCIAGFNTEKHRVGKGVSVEDLCWAVGISTDTYKEFLLGRRRLEDRAIRAIADMLGTTASEMVRYTPGDAPSRQERQHAKSVPKGAGDTRGRVETPTGKTARKVRNAGNTGGYDPDEAARLLSERFKGKVSRL